LKRLEKVSPEYTGLEDGDTLYSHVVDLYSNHLKSTVDSKKPHLNMQVSKMETLCSHVVDHYSNHLKTRLEEASPEYSGLEDGDAL
jgi:hypothetical protein